MILIEKEIRIPYIKENTLIDYFKESVNNLLQEDEIPIRFSVTKTDQSFFYCELGVIQNSSIGFPKERDTIFEFRKRKFENCNSFNAIMIVPTGIGCEIGGHAGDATPAARLLASVCDTFITHPNVVNASDINEMPKNGLYVEGSVLSDLLNGTCGLNKIRSNRLLLLIDKHQERRITDSTINAVSAARATLGLDCPIVAEIDPPLLMTAEFSSSGSAVGKVENVNNLLHILEKYEGQYDAVGIASVINVPEEYHSEYFEKKGEMVNPWGGVEAMLTHAITLFSDLPTAHSPMFESMEISNLDVGIVDPRMAAEAVSACFLHCILKGLHDSPQIIRGMDMFSRPNILTVEDISCVVIPDNCIGLPILAAMQQGIPVIAVKENANRMQNDLKAYSFDKSKLIFVENYLEAAGVMSALKSGVSIPSIRRPFKDTNKIYEEINLDINSKGSFAERVLNDLI